MKTVNKLIFDQTKKSSVFSLPLCQETSKPREVEVLCNEKPISQQTQLNSFFPYTSCWRDVEEKVKITSMTSMKSVSFFSLHGYQSFLSKVFLVLRRAKQPQPTRERSCSLYREIKEMREEDLRNLSGSTENFRAQTWDDSGTSSTSEHREDPMRTTCDYVARLNQKDEELKSRVDASCRVKCTWRNSHQKLLNAQKSRTQVSKHCIQP